MLPDSLRKRTISREQEMEWERRRRDVWKKGGRKDEGGDLKLWRKMSVRLGMRLSRRSRQIGEEAEEGFNS